MARELYLAEPDQFVARRSELTKKFRSAGDKELARAVAALRKPTKSAHLLNVLAHDRPEVISALADLASELQRAQRALDGPRLRELTATRRELFKTTLAAVAELADDPLTPGILEEITSTLTAALADQQIAAQLQAGLVVQPGEWSGFGLDIGPALTVLPGGADTEPKDSSSAGRRSARRTPAGHPAAADGAQPEPEPEDVAVGEPEANLRAGTSRSRKPSLGVSRSRRPNPRLPAAARSWTRRRTSG